jgi:hypothetical protein
VANLTSLGKAVLGVAVFSRPLAEGFEVFGADFDVSSLGVAAWPRHAVIVSYPFARGPVERKIFRAEAPIGIDDKSVGMGRRPILVFFIVPIETDDGS